MKKIGVVTSTRAEYGLLSPVIQELRKKESEALRIDLIVTGTHLSDQYGMTIREIEATGDRIDHTIPIPVDSRDELDISRNQADALVRFTELFCREKYDAVMLLGDRYEERVGSVSLETRVNSTTPPAFLWHTWEDQAVPVENSLLFAQL